MPTIPLRERPAWKALEQHYSEIGGRHLRELFAGEPGRGERREVASGRHLRGQTACQGGEGRRGRQEREKPGGQVHHRNLIPTEVMPARG